MRHTHTVRDALEAALPAVEYYHHHEEAEALLNQVQLALSNPDPLLSELVEVSQNMVRCFNANDSDSMANAVLDAVAVLAKVKGGAA